MGARFSAPVQTGPGAHPTSCTMGTRSFPGVKSGRGVTLTPSPPFSAVVMKGRAIPPLLLRALRPVQSLSACIRVHFTFYLIRKCVGAIHKLLFFLKNTRKQAYESSCSMSVLHFNLGYGWRILTKLCYEPYATEGHPTALPLRTAVLKSVLSTSRSHELVRWNVS